MHKGIMLAKRCDRKTIFKTRHNSARNSDEDVFLGTGGGGPKADLLRKMIAQEGLEGRVEMVGPVPHERARDLLVSLPSTVFSLPFLPGNDWPSTCPVDQQLCGLQPTQKLKNYWAAWPLPALA